MLLSVSLSVLPPLITKFSTLFEYMSSQIQCRTAQLCTEIQLAAAMDGQGWHNIP